MVVFIAAITLDRLFKVVHLHYQLNKILTPCAIKIAVMVWITAVVIYLHIVDIKVFLFSLVKITCLTSKMQAAVVWLKTSPFFLISFLFLRYFLQYFLHHL